MSYDISKIESELKKRLAYPYVWGRMQNDYFDSLTNFIYHFPGFDEVLKEIEKKFRNDRSHKNIANYALNRWYNFWSARAVEMLFCELPGIVPALDNKDKLMDFKIGEITFDHKTTIFPQNFAYTINEAINNKIRLIDWLYKNQSVQNRQHFKNRLFIVLYSADGNHWKLKSEIGWLKQIIKNYVSEFNPQNLSVLDFNEGEPTLADIIWAIKN